MIDVFRLTEAMKDLWGASGTEIEERGCLFNFKQNIQTVFHMQKTYVLSFYNLKSNSKTVLILIS
jgi:hypothetical protein